MSVETFNPESAVSVTETAQEHFRQQLKGKNAGIRLSVKESGCTGFMYVVDIQDKPKADDISINLDNGVPFYVAKQALPIVRGTVINLEKQGVNQSLTFKNPNVADECGCGESFSIN